MLLLEVATSCASMWIWECSVAATINLCQSQINGNLNRGLASANLAALMFAFCAPWLSTAKTVGVCAYLHTRYNLHCTIEIWMCEGEKALGKYSVCTADCTLRFILKSIFSWFFQCFPNVIPLYPAETFLNIKNKT